jgi:hypothetical protein
MRAWFAWLVVVSMAAIAVFVQLAVWGATKIRGDGALLESWQPYFGRLYGVLFALLQVGVCLWLEVPRGVVWLVRTWALSAVLLVLIWGFGGRSGRLTANDTVALVSGLGALVLAVGLFDGKLVPGPDARSRP